MRTTLTLDDDVAALLEKEMAANGTSLKATVNHLIKLGLAMQSSLAPAPFRVEPLSLGLPPGMSYDNVQELLDQLDHPDHRQ